MKPAPERDPEFLWQARPYDHALFAVERMTCQPRQRQIIGRRPTRLPFHLRMGAPCCDLSASDLERGRLGCMPLAAEAFLKQKPS